MEIQIAELSKTQVMAIEIAVSQINSIKEKVIAEIIATTTTTTILDKDKIRDIVTAMRIAISTIFSKKGLSLLFLMRTTKAFTYLTASKSIPCSRRTAANYIDPLVKMKFLNIRKRRTSTRPIHIFYTNDATEDDINRAEAEHKKNTLFNEKNDAKIEDPVLPEITYEPQYRTVKYDRYYCPKCLEYLWLAEGAEIKCYWCEDDNLLDVRETKENQELVR